MMEAMLGRLVIAGLFSIALLAAAGCGDSGKVKPHVVDLAGNRIASEDAGSAAASAPAESPGTVASDDAEPGGDQPDDGAEAAPDAREAAANKGTLPDDAISDVFARGTPAVRKCYERELKRTPALTGRMVFSIKVGRTGKVEAARLKAGTLKNKPIERCIVATIKRWKFARPTGGSVLVTYPISFTNK
jgi:TonB family protein